MRLSKAFPLRGFSRARRQALLAGTPPTDYRIAREVQVADFGKVDYVLADVHDNNEVAQFLSVELQAMDFSGSVMPAYQALRPVPI